MQYSVAVVFWSACAVLMTMCCTAGDEAKENQDPGQSGMLDASVPMAEANVAAMVSLADRPSCANPQSAALPSRPEFEELD